MNKYAHENQWFKKMVEGKRGAISALSKYLGYHANYLYGLKNGRYLCLPHLKQDIQKALEDLGMAESVFNEAGFIPQHILDTSNKATVRNYQRNFKQGIV